ncbi:hypothetical protein ACAG96_04105 [Candidatus Izemoplasma sp. B36]|uniref:TMEM164 family acyltransferase n=1 Tax=Candidatus Izemoplasma sp. B36 TaxID=3242468 RepID=UPI00355631E8
MSILLNGLVTTGPAYDWFTFSWWGIVFITLFLITKYLPKYVIEKRKRLVVIKIFATVGLLSHLSLYYVTYFQTGGNNIGNAVDSLFFIAPCNMMTWLLFITFFFNESKFRDKLFIVGAYGGLFFGLITMFYPDFYPGYVACDFSIGFWKSIIFHSIMVMTSSLIFAFKIVKPKASDGAVMFIALILGFYLYGYPLTLLAEKYGINMDFLYVRTFPIKDIFSVQFSMILFFIVITTIGFIYEYKTLEKDHRTIIKLSNFIQERYKR